MNNDICAHITATNEHIETLNEPKPTVAKYTTHIIHDALNIIFLSVTGIPFNAAIFVTFLVIKLIIKAITLITITAISDMNVINANKNF